MTVLSLTVVTDHKKISFNLRRPNLRKLVRFSNNLYICTLTSTYAYYIINKIHFDFGNINAVICVGDKLNSSIRDYIGIH